MAHLDIDTALGWRGRTVRDPDGEKIGTLGELFLDRETDMPAWAGVRTGLFGHRESYVPLDRLEEDGDDLRLPYPKDHVKGAPQIDPDVALTAEEEHTLFDHYGHGPETHEVTRSEEEVHVEPGEMRATERVRLRKVQVTEDEVRTVPVRREVVQLETEPPPEGRIEHVEDIGETSTASPEVPRGSDK